jgi:hypothetical protein
MTATATDAEPRPQLRPLSLGEALDVSIKICAANWRTLLKTVLVIVVPVEIVSTLVSADYTTSSFDFSTNSEQTPEQSLDELNQQLGGIAISTILRIIAVLLVSAACFRVIAQAYLGKRTDWRGSLSYALRHVGSLLWLGLLYLVGVGFATLFFILPGVWLYVAWAFAVPALFVEGKRGSKALGRSHELVKGRWWKTFAVLAIGFTLAGIVSSVVQFIFVAGIFADSNNDALVLVLSALAGIVGLAISTPFQAALITVVYFDLRVRKEGFDLELLAQAMAGDGSTAPERTPLAAEPDVNADDHPRLPGVP